MSKALSKNYLRKTKDAVQKFNEAKSVFETVFARMKALHDAIRPLIGDLTAPERDSNDLPILKATYTIPLQSGPVTISRDTPPDQLREKLSEILSELDSSGIALAEARKELEGRHKFLLTISGKGERIE